MRSTSYNERSWAIDLISEINLIVTKRRLSIRRASGERTLKSRDKTPALFPDVLLFQDDQNIKVLQGWELKMPDTPISDPELIKNAQEKAARLGLDSFLVWNVNEAVLYISDHGQYKPKATWNISQPIARSEVEQHRSLWLGLLNEIIDKLEEFFLGHTITGKNILSSLADNRFIDVILDNSGLVQQNIAAACTGNSILAAEIDEWWQTAKIEYSADPTAYTAISRLVLVAWVNRFLFTHYLKKFTTRANIIDTFNESTTVPAAKEYFAALTKENDFLNVYAPVPGEDYIDDASWLQVLQLNAFLSELRLENIDQHLLQQFFEQLFLVSKRKGAGQYATPYGLANYLARLVLTDKRLPVMDCFCGTGTIVRACYDVKLEFGVSPQAAIETVWGSDKYSFPLQMTTLSLARPEIMGQVINVFKSDVIALQTGNNYPFTDPATGRQLLKALPSFDYLISNLPFVESARIAASNPQIFSIVRTIQQELHDTRFRIPPKSDLIAYLPYYLWYLLKPGGRLGLIVSNAWLGTDWGEQFRHTLNRFYHIETVIASDSGKWFHNAKVVANLLVLKKRDAVVTAPPDIEATDFVTLHLPIVELQDTTKAKEAAHQTLLKRGSHITIRSLAKKDMADLKAYGLSWPSYFANLSWLPAVKDKLVKANTLFDIGRGERRGWDAMFFPAGGHGIEQAYLKPVLKSFRRITKLTADPDGMAFCCSSSIAELTAAGAHGALAWIERFEHGTNETGEPLITSLARSNHHWYEMKAETVADLIATINYGETLFIAKMRERSFVNQRLIPFTARHNNVDIDLCHALMNSYLGLFYIEALGFGRGMGALDLNSTKLKKNYYLLNPGIISVSQIEAIKEAFEPLKEREILLLPNELELDDRPRFEKAVAQSYGLDDSWNDIKASLLALFNMRVRVND